MRQHVAQTNHVRKPGFTPSVYLFVSGLGSLIAAIRPHERLPVEQTVANAGIINDYTGKKFVVLTYVRSENSTIISIL